MTQVSATTSATTGTATKQQNPLGKLGESDFLNLLVAQLKYQDPLSPTDNTQFMAQLAQFSMVDGINNVQATLGSLQGVGLIGKQVTYTAADGSTQTGIATAIALSGGTYSVQVGSDAVDPSKIVGVSDPPPPTTTTSTGTSGTATTPTGTSGTTTTSTGTSGTTTTTTGTSGTTPTTTGTSGTTTSTGTSGA